MVHHHEDYAGPAALARAYSLMADSRDALLGPRLAAALASCHDCRTEANCTEVCPKGISPTRAIKYIQRLALTANVDTPDEAAEPAKEAQLPEARREIDRRTVIKGAGVALLGAGVAACLGGIAIKTTIGPEQPATAPEQWIPLAKVSELPPAGQVLTVLMHFEVKNGIYSQSASRPVMISHLQDQLICYKTACPHLGCTVRWDGRSDEFRCACHGGTFNREGEVVGGPPPHGLDKYQHKIEGDQLYVLL
jgi:succinate dehydrogenase / fumarate reductase iron-sulfur subunit